MIGQSDTTSGECKYPQMLGREPADVAYTPAGTRGCVDPVVRSNVQPQICNPQPGQVVQSVMPVILVRTCGAAASGTVLIRCWSAPVHQTGEHGGIRAS